MAEIKYVGPHGPNEVRNVLDKRVNDFLKTGVYERVNDNLILDKSRLPKEKNIIGVKEEENVKKYSFKGVKIDEEE